MYFAFIFAKGFYIWSHIFTLVAFYQLFYSIHQVLRVKFNILSLLNAVDSWKNHQKQRHARVINLNLLQIVFSLLNNQVTDKNL